MSTPKAQSAMEYLMTYGWAILIIAVVLGALYYLGVFNTANLAPRAQPGSCKVVRPNGPGTTTFINLAGVCTGQLPLFVGSFDGASSTISLGTLSKLATSLGSHDTVSFWMYWTGDTSHSQYIVSFDGLAGGVYQVGLGNSGSYFGFSTANGDIYGISSAGLAGKWVHVVADFYNGAYTGNSLLYVNGASQGLSQLVGSGQIGTIYTRPYLGAEYSTGTYYYYFNGQISNVQIYNTSLSAAEVQGLYIEGIGGAPTRLQNLVGWWPLNGNANDYSGNGNNGVQTNVVYTSTWTR